MYRHPYFNLYLHDDNELGEILQAEIVVRCTLHEWPLSCVEQLTTDEGIKWIYKSQFGPTVEPEFYANARSRLLVAGKTVSSSQPGSVNMLLEFVEAPLIEDLNLSDDAILTAGHTIIERIAEIEGELPYYLDISEAKLWEERMETTLVNLAAFVSQGIFRAVDQTALQNLRKWAFSKEVLAALERNVGLVHNDLSGDNVFVTPDGYTIIDWQRPARGPRELDLAVLLESLDRGAERYVDQSVVWIMYLLRMAWFTECALRWFPQGRDDYDTAIHQLINRVGKSA